MWQTLYECIDIIQNIYITAKGSHIYFQPWLLDIV